jgi:hypothetical protein
MKSNLMIKRYRTEFDNGTKNMKTIKSYFGSTLIDIEDEIIIDNISLQYQDINGYQNYDIGNLNNNETNKYINLTELKLKNHTIGLQNQNITHLENNSKWEINLKLKDILREYLFAKIKESRSFKTVKQENTKNDDINLAIYNFINYNILNRYQLNRIDFYLKYVEIKSSNIFNRNNIQYNPIFDENLYNIQYLIKDYKIIKKDQFENLTPIKIQYNQTKSSKDFKFDYYFNIIFSKI